VAKKTIKLPNGNVITLTKKEIDEKVSKHVDKAISTAVKDIKASLPQEADLSAVEASLAALKGELMQLQASVESLSEARTEPPEAPEIPMDEIKTVVQNSVQDSVKNSVQGIQLPPVLGPAPKKTEYTFEIIRDKDGFIDSVKATPS
jgi:hypothetical protein